MKIKLDINEIISFYDFELNWRWDNNHNPNISTLDKDLIKPLGEQESKRINKAINYFELESNLYKSFVSNEWIRASSETKTSTEAFSNIFLEELRDYEENLFISWNRSTCVYTTKEIFAKYWDDFCYPVSDDITIISELTNWVFFYRHFEVGLFWKRKK